LKDEQAAADAVAARGTTAGSDTLVLEVRALCAGYRNRKVIRSISFSAKPGEIVAIVGPNGSGKSTLIKAVFGFNRIFSGQVLYRGSDVTRQPAHTRAGAGIIYLPQGNRTFDELTVRENLELGGYILPKHEARERIRRILPLFPALADCLGRPAYTLSGGERQMVAFARAMLLEPKLLLLDEPSVGLSPLLVREVMQHITQIRDRFGCAVLVVEQKIEQVLTIADRALALRMGRLVFAGSPGDFRERSAEVMLR
jgi:branched-chain amino acid transport system ATP-binding protein